MDLTELSARLADKRLGHTLEHHAVTTSTNDRARDLAERGAREGVAVLADAQTAGRGRMGRTWENVSGASLLVSVLLRPSLELQARGLLSLATCIAAVKAIRDTTGVEARTKWPNDVVYAERPGFEASGAPFGKLCGILLEGSGDAIVIGIGFNVNAAPEVRDARRGSRPMSIAEVAGRTCCREALLVSFLGHLEDLYAALERGDAGAVLEPFRALDITTGRKVTLHIGAGTITGTVSGIDDAGQLVLETGDGQRKFAAGEATLSGARGQEEWRDCTD